MDVFTACHALELTTHATSACSRRGSPDAHAILGIEVHLLSGHDVEWRVPGVDVAHRHHAETRWRVHVGGDAVAQGGVAHLGAPALREGEEETLVAGEA